MGKTNHTPLPLYVSKECLSDYYHSGHTIGTAEDKVSVAYPVTKEAAIEAYNAITRLHWGYFDCLRDASEKLRITETIRALLEAAIK